METFKQKPFSFHLETFQKMLPLGQRMVRAIGNVRTTSNQPAPIALRLTSTVQPSLNPLKCNDEVLKPSFHPFVVQEHQQVPD